METVLITGSSGALGQAVIRCLSIESDYRILATGRYAVDKDLKVDLRQPGELATAVRKFEPELILHLAATFTDEFDEAFATNVEATRLMLKAVQQSGRQIRVLLIGSAAEYGLIRPEENPISESHVLNPVSVYGLTKAWQSQIAGLYAKLGVNVTTARVFNLEGPGLSEELFVGRIEKQIIDVINGTRSTIEVGDLSASRDYISTELAARKILQIASKGAAGQVYHVASGKPIKMSALLARYLSSHNLDSTIVREATDPAHHPGYDVPLIYADTTRTTQLLQHTDLPV